MVRPLRCTRCAINKLLDRVNLQLVRPQETDYIKRCQPLRKTLKAAQRAGEPVGDYIDRTFQIPGATQDTINQMRRAGAFGSAVGRICEIGPGSGRYLSRVQQLCQPCEYEIYETDPRWSSWLVKTYGVKAREADGSSLCENEDESFGLVHAHKVFTYLPCVVVCNYFSEMIRVLRKGGLVAFDVTTEGCMTEAILGKWLAARIFYPCMMPREFVIQFFKTRGCSPISSFFAPMMPGKSEYFVFAK
jgi:SAM-dependent methyltransferase